METQNFQDWQGGLFLGDTKKISSIHDMFDVLVDTQLYSNILFRGQANDWPLLPKIARFSSLLSSENTLDVENNLFNSFKIRSIPFLNREKPSDDWEWLSLARHHGLPTRLLDWTSNPFTALWFAIQSIKQNSKDNPVLYALSVSKTDLTIPRTIKIFDIGRTYVFQPNHISGNIVAQQGWFTIHKFSKEKNKFIPLQNNKNFKSKLRKFEINRSCVISLQDSLYKMGITQVSLFPNLDHLCQSLEEDLIRQLQTQ